MNESSAKILEVDGLYFTSPQTLQSKIDEQEKELERLRIQLEYERALRERESGSFTEEKTIRKKREVTPETNTYSEYKSNGVRKARPAEPIRSYDDFKAMQNYFLDRRDVRGWTMWTVGVSLGLRISDLLSLKPKNLFEEDGVTFRPRIKIYEQKTGKLQNCLITDSVKEAVRFYFDNTFRDFKADDYLFPSKKTGGKMYEEYGWKLISDAGKACGFPFVVGSHTMRKSFATIAACVDGARADMDAISKVQGLLNHSDSKSTMRYLGVYQAVYDKARAAVSDFVLGKTDVNELSVRETETITDVLDRIEELEMMLKERN